MRSTADWLEQTAKNLTKLLAQHPLPCDLGRLLEQVPELAKEIKGQQQFMFSACEQIADFKTGDEPEGRERPRHRFVGGLIPDHLREMGIELKKGRPNGPKMKEQAARYAAAADIRALIVVVEKWVNLPNQLAGKPLYTISLNRLWGIALP